MRAYEVTYVLRPSISDGGRTKILDKIKSITKAHKGEVLDVEDWGRRRLAYPIEGETRAYYSHVFLTGNSDLIAELERNFRINENIVRYLSVKIADDYSADTYKRRPSPNVKPASREISSATPEATEARS